MEEIASFLAARSIVCAVLNDAGRDGISENVSFLATHSITRVETSSALRKDGVDGGAKRGRGAI
jgi:hypothetical protein